MSALQPEFLTLETIPSPSYTVSVLLIEWSIDLRAGHLSANCCSSGRLWPLGFHTKEVNDREEAAISQDLGSVILHLLPCVNNGQEPSFLSTHILSALPNETDDECIINITVPWQSSTDLISELRQVAPGFSVVSPSEAKTDFSPPPVNIVV